MQQWIQASLRRDEEPKSKYGRGWEVCNTKVSCLLLALMFHKCARSGIRPIPNVNVSPWMSIYLEASFSHSFHKRDGVCITCSFLQVQLFPPFAWSDPSNTPHQKTCCVCVLYHHPFRSVRLIKLCTSSFFSQHRQACVTHCIVLFPSRSVVSFVYIIRVEMNWAKFPNTTLLRLLLRTSINGYYCSTQAKAWIISAAF